MGVLDLHDFAIDAIYEDNGVDYLYTRGFIHATVLVNGEVGVFTGTASGPVMTYDFGEPVRSTVPGRTRPGTTTVPAPTMPPAAGIDVGIANLVPRTIVNIPNVPPLTHQTIRHRLETPRGQLYIFSGAGIEAGTPIPGTSAPPVSDPFGSIMLSSPGLTNLCDCKNGPFPKVLAINAALGDANTFICEWMCETFFNEARLNNTSPISALLSNRFFQTHSVDDEAYTTIKTQGNAIYRTDLVFRPPMISPDSERAQLFMPIPQGFVRRIDYVEGLPDVTGVMYGYTDTQQKTNYVAGPYTRSTQMTVLHRQAVTTGDDILTGALSTYERSVGLLLNTKWLKQKDAPEHPVPATPGGPGARRLRGGGVPPRT